MNSLYVKKLVWRILLIPLLILVLWKCCYRNCVIVVIPDNYTGEIYVVKDSKTAKRRTLFERISGLYKWESDATGLVAVEDDSIRYEWHSLQSVSVCGRSIPAFTTWDNTSNLNDPTTYIFLNYYNDPQKGTFFVGTLREAKKGFLEF